MKKKIYTLALALLGLFCSVDVMAQTWKWTGSTPSAGNSYYLYADLNGCGFLNNTTNSWDATPTVLWNMTGTFSSSYSLTTAAGKQFAMYRTSGWGASNNVTTNGNNYSGDDILLSSNGSGNGPYTIYRANKFSSGQRNIVVKSSGLSIDKSATSCWRFISTDEKSIYDVFNYILAKQNDVTETYKINGEQAAIVDVLYGNEGIVKSNTSYSPAAKNNLTEGKEIVELFIEVWNEINEPKKSYSSENQELAWTALKNATTKEAITNALNKLYAEDPEPTFTWTKEIPAQMNINDNFSIVDNMTSNSNGVIKFSTTDRFIAEIDNGVIKAHRPGNVTITIEQEKTTGYKASKKTYDIVVIDNSDNNIILNDKTKYTIGQNGTQEYDIDKIPSTISFTINTTGSTGLSNANMYLEESSDGITWNQVWASGQYTDEKVVNNIPLSETTKKIHFRFSASNGLVSGSVYNVVVKGANKDAAVFENKSANINTNGAATLTNSFQHSNAYGKITLNPDNTLFTIEGADNVEGGYGINTKQDFTVKFTPTEETEYGTYTANITISDQKILANNAVHQYDDTYTVTVDYRQPVISEAECETGIIVTEEATFEGSFKHKDYIGENISVSSDNAAFVVNFNQKNTNSFGGAATETFTVTFNPAEDGTYEGTITISVGDVEKTIAVAATRKTTHSIAAANTLKLNNANISTLCLPYNAEIPENAKAFTGVIDQASNTLVLSKIEEGAIPANTAVVVSVADDATADFNKTDATPATIEANALKGVLVQTPVADVQEDGMSIHTLGLGNESGMPGFFVYQGTTLAAYKAYLPIPTASAAKGIKMAFATPTGIKTITSEAVKNNAPIYNLSGQRVNANAKGIVIINGQKVLNK